MEYVSYILVTLGILLGCLFLMRFPARPIQKRRSLARIPKIEKEARQKMNGMDTGLRSDPVLQRELMHVPTPWGWPGHRGPASFKSQASADAQEVHGVSESINQFVERLFSEKRTVDSQEYLLRKDASLRTLIEDRYGRASTMKAIPYRQVKPPRLRDPSQPHDQMDNFPSGKVDQIAARIPRQPETAPVVKQQSPMKKTADLHMVRTPWGW
jgi:hypothetical protein